MTRVYQAVQPERKAALLLDQLVQVVDHFSVLLLMMTPVHHQRKHTNTKQSWDNREANYSSSNNICTNLIDREKIYVVEMNV